jgi:hypothetical protein
MAIQRRTFSQVPAPEMAPAAVAEHGGEVSAPAAADATSPDGEVETSQVLAGEPVAAESAPAAEPPLQRAQAALASNDADIARLADRRNALLLEDVLDEAAIARLDADLARHEHKRRTLGDRLVLLGAEQARLDAEAAAAAREARIVEVERTLVERDAAVMDLRDALVSANRAFQRAHELNIQIRAGWGWGHGKLGGTLTASSDLTQAVSAFLFKVGGRPPLTGGEFQPNATPQFPGARCPRLEWQQTPDRCPDLAAVYRLASKYASDAMRGITPVPEPVPASSDTTGKNLPVAEQSPVMPAVGITGTQSPNVPTLSAQMVEILRRQAELAMRDDPASEAEYLRNGELLREMSA